MSTPIKRENIRKGDRVRLIATSEFTAYADFDADEEGDDERYELIERPVVLPTEPGTVIAIGEWWLVKLRPYHEAISGSWEFLPVPASVKASVERAGQRDQCVYANEWVQAEAEQEGGFTIISAPVVNA